MRSKIKKHTVDCGHCTGHGMGIGIGGTNSKCFYCRGVGYFVLTDESWIKYCDDNNLHEETGDDLTDIEE